MTGGEGGEGKEAAVRRSLEVGERRRRGVVVGGAAMAAATGGQVGVDLRKWREGRSSGEWGTQQASWSLLRFCARDGGSRQPTG